MQLKKPRSLSEDKIALWKSKRSITFPIYLFQAFVQGINYMMVAPTLWPYLKQLNASNPKILYGLSFGCQALMAAIVGLVASRFGDRTRRIKVILLFIDSLVVLGNICYVVGISPYLLLFGRFLAGSGIALNPVLVGEISRCFEPELLTGIFAVWSFVNGLGFVLGPATSVFFQNVNFWIGWLHITYVNVSAFCVAIAFTLIQGLILLCASDLSREYDLKEMLGLQQEEAHEITEKYEDFEDQDCEKEHEDEKDKEAQKSNGRDQMMSSSQLGKLQVIQACFRNQTIVTLFSAGFIFGFSVMSYEVIPSLIASKFLKLISSQIGMAYLFSGIYYIILCLTIWKIRKYISVVKMFFAGFIVNSSACIFAIVLGFQNHSYPITLFVFIWLMLTFPILRIMERIALRVLTARSVTSANQSFVEALRYNIVLIGLSAGASLAGFSTVGLQYFGSIVLLATIIEFGLAWKARKMLYNPKPII